MSNPTDSTTVAALAEFRGEVHALTRSMETMTSTMERVTEKLERLVAMEVLVQGNEQAINRAFAEISTVNRDRKEDRERVEKKHGSYDKSLNVAIGFMLAVSVFWTVTGYRLNSIIDDQVQVSAEMRRHIIDDRIKTPEDVRSAVKARSE